LASLRLNFVSKIRVVQFILISRSFIVKIALSHYCVTSCTGLLWFCTTRLEFHGGNY